MGAAVSLPVAGGKDFRLAHTDRGRRSLVPEAADHAAAAGCIGCTGLAEAAGCSRLVRRSTPDRTW
jgi:hypothetical protein